MDKFIEEQGTFFALRLSNRFEGCSFDNVKSFCDTFEKYILATEGNGVTIVEHYHILVVSTTLTLETLKKALHEFFPHAKGNKDLYCKLGRNKRQLSKYTVKDGEFVFKGFTQKYIDEVFKCSSKKDDLREDFVKNEDSYLTGRIDFDDFVDKYINLKVDHDQPLYMQHIEAYSRKFFVKKDRNKSRIFSRMIVDKIVNN